jgi:protein-L-isoaspartate(D-aspartate) O-methyltransferase
MVEGQIRPNKVTHSALVAALLEIPREDFVPQASRSVAYVDEDIRVSPGRYLIEPMVLARLINEAQVAPSDIVLDVGAATGYSTAVLARIASSVVAVESDPALAAQAGETLRRLGSDNATVVTGPLPAGYPRQAPYNVILINGAVPEVPDTLLDQLTEGGRLAAVVSADGRLGQARLYRRIHGIASSIVLFDAATPLLPGFEPAPRFVF